MLSANRYKEYTTMSQAVQNNNGKTNLAFSNVQAYTLAVITLAIGIAVGYFARGSAPVSPAPAKARRLLPLRSRRNGQRTDGLGTVARNRKHATAAGGIAGNVGEGSRAAAGSTEDQSERL